MPTNQTLTGHRFPRPEGPYWQLQTMPAELVSVPPSSTTPHTRTPSKMTGRPRCGRGPGPPARGWRPVLLRKEVIQPHLPVRLPCYDFVPIADPTFDGSFHKG